MTDESEETSERRPSDTPGVTDGGTATTGRGGVLGALSGPHTIGESRAFWVGFVAVVLLAASYPMFVTAYGVISFTTFYIWVLLALSLCFVWGYAGIFSFGQTAFFGVGGYSFGVVGTNLLDVTGGTTLALLAAIVVPAIVAAVLGYFVFYGRVSGVYVGIITFAVTLIFGLVLARSSGVRIGEASLGGSNGMTGIPSLVLGAGGLTVELNNILTYYFVLAVLVGGYLALRYFLNSSYGYVMVATREDEQRTEMFGYDVRRVKVVVFAVGAGMAGFAGAVHAASGNFVGPGTMSLTGAIIPVIWITVGGRKTLLGTIAGAFALQYVAQRISFYGSQYSLILLGAIVLVAILAFPEGVVPNLHRRIVQLTSRWQESADRSGEHRDHG